MQEKGNGMKDTLLKAFLEIDNSAKICYGTLAKIVEYSTDDNLSWMIIGSMEQLDKIKNAAELIDKTMRGEAVA